MSEHWIERLSDYLDDDLSAADRAACDAHLRTCETCRDALAGLETVIQLARQAPDRPPAADLWPGVAARIAAPPAAAPWPPPAARRVSFSLPQLALAASLLIAVSAGGAYLAARRAVAPPPGPVILAQGEPTMPSAGIRPANFGDASYDAAVGDLERILASERKTLDPTTVRVIERNLQAIDEAIRQSRAALDADPANPFLNSHLADARQRKLDLLRRAALLTVSGGD